MSSAIGLPLLLAPPAYDTRNEQQFRTTAENRLKSVESAADVLAAGLAALGGASSPFADLYLESGAVIDWGTGDVTLTHAANELALAGGTIRINGNGFPTTPQLLVYTDDGIAQANITTASYGINGGGTFHGNHANGTRASPTASLSGDITGGIGSRAYHSGGAFQASSPASIHWVVSEDQTGSAYGMYLRFLTTPKGSTTRQERVIISDSGTLWVHDTGTFDPKVAAQTKPVSDIALLASGAGSVSAGVFTYGTSLTAGYRGGNATGTPASPGATAADAVLNFLGGSGYETTGNAFTASKGIIFIKAAEAFTNTAQGTYIDLEVTPTGSTTRARAVRINNDKSVTFEAGISATNVLSGTYTPTLTNVANTSSLTAFSCQYLRVGSVVTVSGKLTLDPVAGATLTQIGISLPIASDFATNEQCGGVGSSGLVTAAGAIYADTANNRAEFIHNSVGTAAYDVYFSFTYLIV
jgi:hypothetical protein